MRKVVAAVAVALVIVVASSQTAHAGSSPIVRTATIDPRSGTPIPVVTRLQPVVGTVQRTSHFSNPITHKARFRSVNYNPVLGTFDTQKFHR